MAAQLAASQEGFSSVSTGTTLPFIAKIPAELVQAGRKVDLL
jgi:hypothetical protein